VNTASTEQSIQISVQGVTSVAPEGMITTLSSANPGDTNSITEPTKIVPVTSKSNGFGNSFTQSLAPYSINVLELHTH
jgi:alpha-N-arabinofuranosidase